MGWPRGARRAEARSRGGGASSWGGRAAEQPLTLLLPTRNTTVLNSKVISVTVKPPPRSLLTPLEIEFAHMYNVSAPAPACH